MYVAGGLYGNIEALDAILAMRDAESARGKRVDLVFNGDFNWFNTDPESFAAINKTVLAHTAIQGNVEAEIGTPSAGGCGCNYPDDVDDVFAVRSDDIMGQLQRASIGFLEIREALARLPMIRVVRVGDVRVGIVHGDAESLAGWNFAADRLAGIAPALHSYVACCFRDAGVTAFACTHTCFPYARVFHVDGASRIIVNNGAAGMANFTATTYGLITRISTDTHVPAHSLYGATIDRVRFDAVPVRFDHARWLGRFLANWPPNTPAHMSYFDRIVNGPRFSLRDAIGEGVVGIER